MIVRSADTLYWSGALYGVELRDDVAGVQAQRLGVVIQKATRLDARWDFGQVAVLYRYQKLGADTRLPLSLLYREIPAFTRSAQRLSQEMHVVACHALIASQLMAFKSHRRTYTDGFSVCFWPRRCLSRPQV
jgi:hypothetical protein